MNWYSKTSELANVRTPDLILHAQMQTHKCNHPRPAQAKTCACTQTNTYTNNMIHTFTPTCTHPRASTCMNFDRASELLPQGTLGGRGARGSAAFAGASWTSSRGASSGQESLGASCAPAGCIGAAMLYCITMDAEKQTCAIGRQGPQLLLKFNMRKIS